MKVSDMRRARGCRCSGCPDGVQSLHRQFRRGRELACSAGNSGVTEESMKRLLKIFRQPKQVEYLPDPDPVIVQERRGRRDSGRLRQQLCSRKQRCQKCGRRFAEERTRPPAMLVFFTQKTDGSSNTGKCLQLFRCHGGSDSPSGRNCTPLWLATCFIHVRPLCGGSFNWVQ